MLEIRVNARRPPTHRDQYYSVGAALISANRKIGNPVHNWILLIQLPTRRTRENNVSAWTKPECPLKQHESLSSASRSAGFQTAGAATIPLFWKINPRTMQSRCLALPMRYEVRVQLQQPQPRRLLHVQLLKISLREANGRFPPCRSLVVFCCLFKVCLKFDANYSESLTVEILRRLASYSVCASCRCS